MCGSLSRTNTSAIYTAVQELSGTLWQHLALEDERPLARCPVQHPSCQAQITPPWEPVRQQPFELPEKSSPISFPIHS